MDSDYSILTLDQGEFRLPFASPELFSREIEERIGILSVNQQFYCCGSACTLNEIRNFSTKSIQLMSNQIESARYHIKTDSHQFRVNVLNPSSKIIEHLLYSIADECSKLGFSYPTDSYTLYLGSEKLALYHSLREIPSESLLSFIAEKTYPLITSISIEIRTLTGKSIEFTISPICPIINVKEFIRTKEGIPIDQQRLVFAGRQLENHKTLQEYNIQQGNCLHLVLNLRGGGGPPAFNFNDLSNQITVQFSNSAPKWRAVSPGISWLGICSNSNCEAFNKQAIRNFGFGVFDVKQSMARATCPMCKKVMRNVSNCGFYSAGWRFFGIDLQGNQRRGNGNAPSENYTTFKDGDNEDWIFLRIEVFSRD